VNDDDLQIEFDTSSETLKAFLASDASNQFVMGPLGSGKTNTFVFKNLALIEQQTPREDGVRRSRVLITRNTYGDLESTTIRDWRAIVGDECGRFVHSHPPEHALRYEMPDGTRVEADVIFVALDRPDHVKRLRGTQISWAWMNEVKEQPKPIFDMLSLRVGRFPPEKEEGCAFAGVLGDYNAPDDDHWLYDLEQLWRKGELPAYEFFIQPPAVIEVAEGVWKVNPGADNLSNLRPGYYENGLQGKTRDWIKVNLANQYGFVYDGKPVHPDYVERLHCSFAELKVLRGIPLYVGMDFGLTPAGVIAQRTANGRWRVLEEITTIRMGAINFAKELKRRLMQERYAGLEIAAMTGDPAGGSGLGDDEDKTIFTVLKANDIDAKPAHTNDFTVRSQAVDSLLVNLIDGEAALQIDGARCPKLRKALGGKYQFKRLQVAGDARFQSKPDKNEWSHVAEALQYLVIGGGEGKKVLGRKKREGELKVESVQSVFD
jgi:hypothetical protein